MDTPTTGTVEAPPVITQEQLDAAAKRAVDAAKGDTKGPSNWLPSIRVEAEGGYIVKISGVVWNDRDMVCEASRYEGKGHVSNFDHAIVNPSFCAEHGLSEFDTARVLNYLAKCDDMLVVPMA
jgi:hypothetical protein